MNLKEQYKHLLNYAANLITLLVEGLCFGYIWYTVYEEQFGFWRRGNWAVVGLYVLVIFFFTKVFGGYNIGYMRMTDIALSHILSILLSGIVGYLELIKKEELSDVVRDYVDVISTRAGKLGEMINSLFSLAKASSGNVELHKETFELNRLMEQIFADMDDRIKESGLKFVTQLTEEDTAIYSDNSYFYRICQNLVENALKYSAKGTRVFIKTYKKEAGTDQKMVLEITNTSGYEMDFEKEDIIERFSRGDKARTSEGNGLGLAIVSTYAKALGGEFDIKIDCDQFKAIVSI